MFNARIVNVSGVIESHDDVELCDIGIIIRVGNNTDVFIPWHRVHDVTSHTRGAIHLELS
jgi:hypothetical protein